MAEQIPTGFEEQPQGNNTMKTCLIAGGVGCGVLLLVVIIGSIIVVQNAKSIGTNMAVGFAEVIVDESQLSDEQKEGIKVQIRRVGEEFKADNLTEAQVEFLLDELTNGPLMNIGMFHFLMHEQVKRSGLTEEETKEAHRTIQRVCRGIKEGSIGQYETQPIINRFQKTDAAGNTTYDENVSDEELREALAESKALADGADVPDEAYEVDIAGDLKDIIDRALAGETVDELEEMDEVSEAPELEPQPASP